MEAFSKIERRESMTKTIQQAAMAATLAIGLVSLAQADQPQSEATALAALNRGSFANEPTIYIAPQNGFETYIAAAITKKHAPIAMTENRDEADYVLESVEEAHEESTGGKIARCLFAYCAGIEGTSNASVQLMDQKTKHILWAYEVRKAGAHNQQSKAEAIAKHLKEWLERE